MLSEKVKLAKSGARGALSLIMELIRPELWGVSGNWRFNYWDREDIVQQALTNICEKLPKLRNEQCFRSWSRSILQNICNDIYKRKKAWDNIIPLQGDVPCLSKTCFSSENSKDLDVYLGVMSIDMAETFRLRCMDDLPIKAIARIQNIPEGTIHSRLHRGKQIILNNYQLYKGD